jgi:hypothetical protein
VKAKLALKYASISAVFALRRSPSGSVARERVGRSSPNNAQAEIAQRNA